MTNRIVAFVVLGIGIAAGAEPAQELSEGSRACIACHRDIETPPFAVYGQWEKSRHYEAGVGCFECHEAEKEDEDSYLHYGYIISLIVSPKDCAECHEQEVEQFYESGHATTHVLHMEAQSSELNQAFISDEPFQSPGFPSADALTAGVTGCLQWHGSRIRVRRLSEEKVLLDPATWPNEGIGRVNPDGSMGSCIPCHERHRFSIAQAREPESCGKCHTWGSGIPMFDIYKASSHGRSYYTNKEEMNLDSKRWIIGKEYVSGPTCASCHVSENKDMPTTHNVSLRFNWGEMSEQARASIYAPPPPEQCACGLPPGTKPDTAYDGTRPVDGRQTMRKVCQNCHSDDLIDGYYVQYMAEKRLVYDKYRIPGTRLYNMAKEVLDVVEDSPFAFFTHAIDFIWFEACSHDAAHAVAAAAKVSADYAYTSNRRLATGWFKDFVPELRRIIETGRRSEDETARRAAQELEAELLGILSDPIYGSGWAGRFDCVGGDPER